VDEVSASQWSSLWPAGGDAPTVTPTGDLLYYLEVGQPYMDLP
jgi:hypothetical protein